MLYDYNYLHLLNIVGHDQEAVGRCMILENVTETRNEVP